MSKLRTSPLSILALATGVCVSTAGVAQAQTQQALTHENHSTAGASAGTSLGPSGPAPAADRKDVSVRRPGARGVLDRKADLGLSDEQAHLLDVIARRYDDQDKLLRDDKARAASRAAEQKEVHAILNDTQREKLREADRK